MAKGDTRKRHVENMKEYVENMEYVKNMIEYVENKYVDILDLALPYRLWD